jgi:anti-sigma factor RsiW
VDCQEFRERLDRYVDGELSAAESKEARAHAEGCESCAKAEAGLRQLRSALKRVVNRHQPPAELERELLHSLRSRGRDRAGRAGTPLDESRRVGPPVWGAKVIVPVPLLALFVLSLVALAGWLVFARGPAREEVSTKRPVSSASPAPSGEASGGFDFSRYYDGERASIRVVRRAAVEGSRQ